ncbi:NAD(P)H-binding protein, partial [Klebsiella pneumoniae]|uniref:NAD(P)H-binding protein n=1 Tax=Klebsiella pneumoniae TaxID=573 RepID=UPI0039C39AF7
EHVHVELPRRLAAALPAAGVRRLVHVSALGVDAQAPSRYLRSKAAGEAVLQVATQTSALDLTVLRPSLVVGAGDRSVNLFAV